MIAWTKALGWRFLRFLWRQVSFDPEPPPKWFI